MPSAQQPSHDDGFSSSPPRSETSGRSGGRGIRAALIVARGAWGATLLVGARRLLASAGAPTPRAVLVGARVLGARQAVEALVLAGGLDRPPPRWSVAVDGLHAMTLLVVAAVSSRYRRDALIGAAVALSFAGLSGHAR
jgi:hypothetical protein